jgi:hypothetical protein
MQRGLIKRPPLEKEATPKNAKGLIQKTTDEKIGNPKKCKGAYSKDLKKKREHQKAGAKRTSNEKRQPNMLL